MNACLFSETGIKVWILFSLYDKIETAVFQTISEENRLATQAQGGSNLAIDAVSKLFGKNREDDPPDQVLNIGLDLLSPNPFQPRKQFDSVQMEELSRSITEIGVIQPIVIRQAGDGYQIVAGERRWRAAKLAGLTTIPSIIRNFSDREMAEIALVENLQRADLNYFEEAEGYRRLIEDFHMTQAELATRIGKTQPSISNKLRLLQIDPDVKDNIMVELLTERHVSALLKLKTACEQNWVLKEIYENELNVNDTEHLIAEYLAGRIAVVREPDEDGTEEDEKREKKQTIRRVFSDMRIYVNTIKAAVSSIIEAGVDAKVEQTETEESIQLTVTLPRIRK